MTRTPSKADLEQKEAERERKIKERKAQKEQEAARRKAEKAAHAEEIRNKKSALDAEKKRGMEKVKYIKKSICPTILPILCTFRYFHWQKAIKQRRLGWKRKRKLSTQIHGLIFFSSLLKKKAEQKRLEEQKRKQEEELRIQEAKRKEEMARWKLEEEQRRAAEEAKVSLSEHFYWTRGYWLKLSLNSNSILKAAELAAKATPQKQHAPVDCYEMTPQGSFAIISSFFLYFYARLW